MKTLESKNVIAEHPDGSVRWFHLDCFNRNQKGCGKAVEFPVKAKSDRTLCTGCLKPINQEKSGW